MTSDGQALYEFADDLQAGDEIRWDGEKSDHETTRPRTVRRVLRTEQAIVVLADGPEGGRAGFCVDEDNSSRAWYGKDERRDMGSVENRDPVDEG
jgi:hypothetical protein